MQKVICGIPPAASGTHAIRDATLPTLGPSPRNLSAAAEAVPVPRYIGDLADNDRLVFQGVAKQPANSADTGLTPRDEAR